MDKRTAKGSSLAAKLAAYHGLWYVAVKKLGAISVDTNFHAWRDYTPLISWVDSLWSSKKLTHSQYLALARETGVGYAARKRDVLEVMRDELDASIHEHVQAESLGLPRLPTRAFGDIDAFVGLFAGPPKWRRPMLVLLGATNFGKSVLGADVLRRIGKGLGLARHVEVTVEADEHIDLSEYDHRQHAGVLLDGVGDTMLLKRNREILQGRPKLCKGGKSATMKYSYPFTLARRAVVVTMDLSASNLHLFETGHWLCKRQNVIVVKLTQEAFINVGNDDGARDPESPHEALAKFTVSQVAGMLRSKDLAGPAQVLEANGVSGADLVAMTAAQLQTELRMSVFAARKVVVARDAFLSAPP